MLHLRFYESPAASLDAAQMNCRADAQMNCPFGSHRVAGRAACV